MPYYLRDNRKSEERELRAIDQISTALKAKDDTSATLGELTVIDKAQRPHNPAITQAYRNLKERFPHLGSQYEWLACFAQHHPGIEISLEDRTSAPGVVTATVEAFGAVRTVRDRVIGDYEVIDAANSHEDLIAVFGNINFPLMYRYTKEDMLEEYTRLGCSEIVDLTWFCFRPVDGVPCGECNPCKYAIREGMAWRFTPESLERYRVKHGEGRTASEATHHTG